MENDVLRPVLSKFLYDRIEEDAVKLHIELGLTLPVNPYFVAKRLGFVIRRFSEITSLDALEILKISSGESRDGLSYYDPKLEKYVIWINDLDTTSAQRLKFTIMHEVGHIRMEHRGDSSLAELIANYYAAYALVPSPLPIILKCDSFMDIIEEFDVSMDCAYNCSRRCMNRAMFGGPSKPYEKRLINYYKNLFNENGR